MQTDTAEMSIATAALKKRSHSVDADFICLANEVLSFQSQREKRSRTVIEEFPEFVDGFMNPNENYSSLDFAFDNQSTSFSTDLSQPNFSCESDWLCNITQNLPQSFPDTDSFNNMLSDNNVIDEKPNIYQTACNDSQTSLTSQTFTESQCYQVPNFHSNSNLFSPMQSLDADFLECYTNIPNHFQTQMMKRTKLTSPPPYSSAEVYMKIEEGQDIRKTVPRRPTSLNLTSQTSNQMQGMFGNHNEKISACSPDPSNLLSSINISHDSPLFLDSDLDQRRKLPVMQSFLDLKKPIKPPQSFHQNFVSSRAPPAFSYQNPAPLFQNLHPMMDSDSCALSQGYESTLVANGHLSCNSYHERLLQSFPQSSVSSVNPIVAEPKVAVSPDTTHSPVVPVMFSNPSFTLDSYADSTNMTSSGDNKFLANYFSPFPSDCQDDRFFNGMHLYSEEFCGLQDDGQSDTTKVLNLSSDVNHNDGDNHNPSLAKKDSSTTDAKISKNILQALMDKIKRNQTVKNQTINSDIMKEEAVYDPKCYGFPTTNRSPTMIFSNSDVFDQPVHCQARRTNSQGRVEKGKLNQSPKYSGSKSFSARKVTVGEADTSQESCNLVQEKKRRLKTSNNNNNSADQSEPLTPELSPVVILRNTNYLDSFTFHLHAPISMLKRPDQDMKTTYLNKGQYYILSLDCNSERLKTNQATLKSIVMVIFQDSTLIGNELSAWKIWHNKQQSFKKRILDVDFKNSSSVRPRGIEEIAFNATAIMWNAECPLVKVNAAVNCLSTDFSNQKGVKGIPLLMQIDTFLDEELVHRAHCNIKVFCDKGAERKVRDEERKSKDYKKVPEEQNSPTSSTSPQILPSNFHPSDNFSKIPVLFNPKPNVPIKTGNTNSKSMSTFDATYNTSDVSSPPFEDKKEPGKITDKIVLYVKQEHEEAFNALVLESPTVDGLLEAIAFKCNVDKLGIKNLYKKSKRGILVKIDDQVIRHYANESAYIIHSSQSEHDMSYDITLQEI